MVSDREAHSSVVIDTTLGVRSRGDPSRLRSEVDVGVGTNEERGRGKKGGVKECIQSELLGRSERICKTT